MLKITGKMNHLIIFIILSIVHASPDIASNSLEHKFNNMINSLEMNNNNLKLVDLKNNEKPHSFDSVITNLIDKSLNVTYYELAPGIIVLKSNDTVESPTSARNQNENINIVQKVIQFAESHVIRVPLSLTEESGRLFFVKGLVPYL